MDGVGQQIRKLRREQNRTIKELADCCKLSTSFISQLERALSSVSIASLYTICQALGITLSDFFADFGGSMSSSRLGERTSEVMKEVDQPAIVVPNTAIKYRFLSRNFPGRQFEILIGEISPGTYYPPMPHQGEEFGYVLVGRLKLTIGDKTYILSPGDSYHFMATTPHGYQADGGKVVKVLWVGTLKYFQFHDPILAPVDIEGSKDTT